MKGENLGISFYRPQESVGHEIAKQRKYEEHLRRMVSDIDYYEHEMEMMLFAYT